MRDSLVPYEPDMTIIHDPITKMVLVSFRGRLNTLGPFPSKEAGICTAEEFCRTKGWKG